MKMKSRRNNIAIMTQQLGFNYGGIMQNYALQKVLSDMGYSVETIDRDDDNPHSPARILAFNVKSLFLRHALRRENITFRDVNKILYHNRRFIRKRIRLSAPKRSTEALEKYFKRKKFKSVVVGSDQVWRPKYSPNLYNFFLDFLEDDTNILKVSYAASFGTNEWEYSPEETAECLRLIKSFASVSVREESGVELCANHLNRKDAVHVLDPTLLLTKKDYSELAGPKKQDIQLFYYLLDLSKEKTEFLNKCSRSMGLSVHGNQAKFAADQLHLDRIEEYIIPPIEGWLRGFRDADFVITDSFHGTVFSIINSKPFIVIVNRERGASRFESLLSKLGLEDRLVYDICSFDETLLTNKIDYLKVHETLSLLKNESISFLKKYF